MDTTDDEGCWSRKKNLGSGAFGVVELWRNDCTGNMIAIKKYKGGVSQLTEKQRLRWLFELKTMNSLSHPNIVGIRRVPDQLRHLGDGVPVLCMEYCGRGDLRTVLDQSENCCGIKEAEALKIMQHISSAVEYLHSRTIVHRDLKPENIVLQGTKEKTIYKLTDLGYARELGEESVDASVVGTRNYLAPEVLWKPSYTWSADYWSLGILFYEVITGNRPFLPNMPITVNWVKQIEKKKFEHICARGDSGSVNFSTEIESPSTISDCMKDHLKIWFRVALQWDPRRRGKYPEGTDHHDNLVLFSLLNQILALKIVYVFVVPLYRIDFYAVNPEISVQAMQNLIREKTNIEIAHQTLTNRRGDLIDQADASLFSCTEEPCLVVFHREKLLPEKPPIPNISRPVRQMLERPQDKVDYDTIRRYCAATLFFIKQELDLFTSYVIALSIKIDLSNRSLESLRESVQTQTTSAYSLMDSLMLDAQSPEHGLMSVELRGAFDTTKAKTQELLERAQEVIAKLDVLSADFEQLKGFSDLSWLEEWTQLHEKATSVYETSLKRNRGQRDSPVEMARLLYSALSLQNKQLQSPKIQAFISDITRFDTNIMQHHVFLNSFEALVNQYRRNLDDILTKHAAEQSSTRQTWKDSMAESDAMIFDNIMLSKLIHEVGENFEGQLVDLGDLEF